MRTEVPGSASTTGMDTWLAEEVHLFRRVFYPRRWYPPQRISRMPRGKARHDMQKLLERHRAEEFAREWAALDDLLAHKP